MRREDGRRRDIVWRAAVVAVLALLSAVQVAPLRSWSTAYPATGGGAGDGLFNMWVLRTATANLADPARGLLHGNIFWPRPDALAFSDTLYGVVPSFALFRALTGGNTVAAYDLSLLLGYTLGALAVYWLARVVGATRAGALFGAALFAVVPYRGAEASHLQLTGILCLFVALGATFRWQQALDRQPGSLRNLRWCVLAGLAAGVALYVSPYVAVMTAVSVGVVVAFRARRTLEYLTGMACTAATALWLASPLVPPLGILQREGYTRWRDENLVRVRMVTWPRSLVYRGLGWARPDVAGPDALFPGVVWCAVALVAAGVVVASVRARPVRGRRTAALSLLLVAAVCVAIGIGPGHGAGSAVYEAARVAVPGMRGVRDSARFFLPAFAATAVVVAIAVSALTVRHRRAPRYGAALVALMALVAAESLARPSVATVDLSETAEAGYRAIAASPPGLVVELPAVLPSPEFARVVPRRMVLSLRDGQPRIDGQSGGFPAHIQPYVELTRALPDPGAVQALRRLGVRTLLLHGGAQDCVDRYGPATLRRVLRALARSGAVERAATAGTDVVVRLRPGPLTPAEAVVAATPPATSPAEPAGCAP